MVTVIRHDEAFSVIPDMTYDMAWDVNSDTAFVMESGLVDELGLGTSRAGSRQKLETYGEIHEPARAQA